MKKTFRKILALLLCVALLCGMGVSAFATDAGVTENEYETVEEYIEGSAMQSNLLNLKYVFSKIINFISNLLINSVIGKALNLVAPESKGVKDYQSFDLASYEGFYAGTETFLDEPAENAKWSVGYAEASIMPSDFGEKEYAKGAYLPYIYGNEMYSDDDGNKEELRVRTVIMSDGSGRGNVVFCSVDAMGLANSDVRKIRNAVSDFADANNIVSINVSCTHIHTGIDSQGVWTDPAGVMVNNAVSDETKTGVDATFLQAIIDGCSASIKEAFADMKEGTLYYTRADIDNYLWDRTSPLEYDEFMYKLEFLPDDASARPTVICSFGCHPESSSFDWDQKTDENGNKAYDKLFSADFIWYMEKLANDAGYNFIYIQGNVSTTTSSRGLSNDGLDTDAHSTALRYGYEMGYICMTMSMTEEERIAFNKKTGDRLSVAQHGGEDGYTVWYEDLPIYEATEVEPLLNVAHKQFFIQIENNVVSTLGKAGIADNLVLRDKLLRYYTVTEVGYMEVADLFKVYLSPGETFTELLKGGKGLEGFPYECIRDRLGENTIIFDLCNDAAGYVANEANYTLVGMQYNESKDEYDTDTWCLISYGQHEGSTLLSQLYQLADSVRE